MLCTEKIGQAILESARFNERMNRWRVGLLVLMPDHLHAIFSLPYGRSLTLTVQNWKRYLTRTYAIGFQRDFFDHRIRSDENYHYKTGYILNNPVRAGLVSDWQDWPYLFYRTGRDGAEPVV